MTDAPAASLALIRKQIAALLSEIDTAYLPRPNKLNSPRSKHPGAEWAPRKGWKMFTVEDQDSAGMVYLDHGCDDIRYSWPVDGDWEALRIEDARAIGLAFLAAAARAEEFFMGVSRLPEAGPAEDLDTTAEVKSLRRSRR